VIGILWLHDVLLVHFFIQKLLLVI